MSLRRRPTLQKLRSRSIYQLDERCNLLLAIRPILASLGSMELSIFVGLGLVAVAFLIGATAIGGLLLVPVLVIFGGYTVHEVIPNCLFSIFFSGIVGSIIFGRKGHVGMRDVSTIALPAGLAAFAGTYLLPLVPSKGIEFIIAVFCFGAFFTSFFVGGDARPVEAEPKLSQKLLVLIGAGTGLGSTLSGTGGPLILIPVLSFLGLGPKRSVGMAQAIQLPIGAFAALGNIAIGAINYRLALPLTGLVVFGSICGALYAQRLNVSAFRPLISIMMLGCGIFYLARLT